jgi:hypothetical protein
MRNQKVAIRIITSSFLIFHFSFLIFKKKGNLAGGDMIPGELFYQQLLPLLAFCEFLDGLIALLYQLSHVLGKI